MKHSLLCPHCKGQLNVNKQVVLTVKTKDGSQRGLLILNSTLGHYHAENHPIEKLRDGEPVDIICPICHENLNATDVHENRVNVSMMDEDQQRCSLSFAGIMEEIDILDAFGLMKDIDWSFKGGMF